MNYFVLRSFCQKWLPAQKYEDTKTTAFRTILKNKIAQ